MSTILDIQKNCYPLSASIWLNELCVQSKPEDNENLTCTDYLRLTAIELGFIATTAFGIIESIFWSSIFLLAKAIHVFIPESALADRIFTQIGISTALTIGATIIAANMIGYNFFMNLSEVAGAANYFGERRIIPFVENHLMGLINYRLFAGSDIVIARAEYNKF